jgi:hypothetical protein
VLGLSIKKFTLASESSQIRERRKRWIRSLENDAVANPHAPSVESTTVPKGCEAIAGSG